MNIKLLKKLRKKANKSFFIEERPLLKLKNEDCIYFVVNIGVFLGDVYYEDISKHTNLNNAKKALDIHKRVYIISILNRKYSHLKNKRYY